MNVYSTSALKMRSAVALLLAGAAAWAAEPNLELAWERLTPMQRTQRAAQLAIGGDAKTLAAHVDDANVEVARAVAQSLGRVGGAEALARLAQLVAQPGSDPYLADARQTALGAALARTAAKDLPLAAAYAKTAFGLPSASDHLRAVAAKVLVMANPDFLATALADGSKFVRQAAVSAAGKVPAATLAKVLAETQCPCGKVVLLNRIAANRAVAALPAVVACVKDGNETVAAAAVETLARLGSPDGVETILAARSRGGNIQRAADEALAEMGGIGEKVFELAAKDPSVLNVAAKRAEVKLVDRWGQFVASSDAQTRKTAWRAFGKMNSSGTFAPALAWFAKVQAEEKDVATTAMWHVLRDLDVAKREATLVDLWKKSASAPAREAAAELLYRVKSFELFRLWEQLAACPTYGAAAKREYVALADRVLADDAVVNAKLDRSQWKGAASDAGGEAAKAFDGDKNTRWSSGKLAKGVWYTLDLGGTFFVESITLDTTGSPKDTPAGCNVFVSFDGATWQGPVAKCDDKTTQTTTFTLNHAARQVKFVALESRPNLWWSIHEIDVKAKVDKALLEKLRATAEKFRASK